jgi:uncharacterized protein DUF6653
MFARHSNPWSAWTRWASTPLVLVPVWTRRRRDAALVATWLALNPVVFPPPADNRAWATRAILGEELSTRRPKDTPKAITAATSLFAIVAIVASARRRPVPAAVSCAAQMALTLVYWEMMARYWNRYNTSAAASASSTGS